MAKGKEKLQRLIEGAERFEVDPSFGLSFAQVESRNKAGLRNKKKKQVTKTYPRIFFENVFNELNVILFLIFALMIYAGLPFVRFFFMIILLANILVGVIQDIHARVLVERLKVVSDPKVKVVREGKEIDIPVREIVLSDILVLALGDQIPADCKLVRGKCSVNEALLTGESVPVKKTEGDTLLSGAFLTSGSCLAEVTAVGVASYAESLENSASAFKRPQSEIQHSIWVIMTYCCVAAVLVGVFSCLAFMVPKWLAGETVMPMFNPMTPEGKEFIDSLSGSMVAMLPAGMFLLTSLTLAVGVILLAKRKMLVQQLYCIEMLARVDTLCLDKTGTLTDGTMSVNEVTCFGHRQQSEIDLAIAALLHFTQDNNLTAVALKKKYGDDCRETCRYAKPFDSEAKYSAVALEGLGTYFLGAYGFVPSAKDPKVEEVIEAYAKKGMRCLLLTRSNQVIDEGSAAKKIENVAVLALSDHLKEDAFDTIALFQNQGVSVKVISGDDPITASEIAKRAGIVDAEKYISLEGVDLEEVGKLANSYSVFGRVNPEQKAALISAMQEEDHKVAMTGDGVNDILALKVADCSIAMASGSSAARNVANLVSVDSDFSKLPDVVNQGRRVINNLQRTCSLFLSKTIFAVFVSLVFLINSAIGGKHYPFTTSNLFVWEVVTIGLAAFALALQPSMERLKGSFIRNISVRAVPAGMAEVFAAIAPFILYKFWPVAITDLAPGIEAFEVAKTLSTICFTIVSYYVLFRVCLPLGKYRATVFGGALVLGIVAFVADFFLRGAFLNLRWDGLKWSFPIVAIIFTALCGGVYYLADHIIVKFILKDQKENEHENQ